MTRILRLFAALALAVLIWPHAASAQESEWREVRSERFAILYIDGDKATAEQYAGFVDGLYDEIAAAFAHKTRVPVTLRLYPTLERYQEANPLARELTGVVAHADFRRHELVVILSQTQRQTDEEVRNNIRHELTHLVAAELSDDRLNVGFQEGVAQYVERPAPELEQRIAFLQRAYDRNQLLSWSQLDDREEVYSQPEVSYPETLSIVAYLVEHFKFAKLRDFLTISGRSSGYRSALERAYATTPDQLERDWRAWLPGYLAGGYKHNALTAYDLTSAEALLSQGRYAEAQTELETAIEWLQTTEQTDTLQQAQQLLEESKSGLVAEDLASQARTALEAAEYDRAADLTKQARTAFGALGDARQNDILEAYAARAARGQTAADILTQAQSLARTFRFPQARQAADHAAAEYLALGDKTRADQALALRSFLDQRQGLLGACLMLLGLLGVAASAIRRFTVREAEAW